MIVSGAQVGAASVEGAVAKLHEATWNALAARAKLDEAHAAVLAAGRVWLDAENAAMLAGAHLREVLLAGVPPAGDA
jgi:hypothetical protein